MRTIYSGLAPSQAAGVACAVCSAPLDALPATAPRCSRALSGARRMPGTSPPEQLALAPVNDGDRQEVDDR